MTPEQLIAILPEHELKAVHWCGLAGSPDRSADPARPWWSTRVALFNRGLLDRDGTLTGSGRTLFEAMLASNPKRWPRDSHGPF